MFALNQCLIFLMFIVGGASIVKRRGFLFEKGRREHDIGFLFKNTRSRRGFRNQHDTFTASRAEEVFSHFLGAEQLIAGLMNLQSKLDDASMEKLATLIAELMNLLSELNDDASMEKLATLIAELINLQSELNDASMEKLAKLIADLINLQSAGYNSIEKSKDGHINFVRQLILNLANIFAIGAVVAIVVPLCLGKSTYVLLGNASPNHYSRIRRVVLINDRRAGTCWEIYGFRKRLPPFLL